MNKKNLNPINDTNIKSSSAFLRIKIFGNI